MWSWDKRKAQTLSPSSANRLAYNSVFTRNQISKSTSSSEQIDPGFRRPPEQRLSHSGIPWGYFTTRNRPLTSQYPGVTPQGEYSRVYGTSPGKSHQLSPPHQHQYSKQKPAAPIPRPTIHTQSKQAPIQKRIDKNKKDKGRYSFPNSPQIGSRENMSVNPLFADGVSDHTVERPVGHINSGDSSLRDKVITREKWSKNKTNSSIRTEFVENSIYRVSEKRHSPDSESRSSSEIISNPGDDDVNNFDQEIAMGQGVPLYASVFKNKQEKPEPQKFRPSSPGKDGGKKDEPLYSTIGERRANATSEGEQSSHPVSNVIDPLSTGHTETRTETNNNNSGTTKPPVSATKQGKEPPLRKFSVLDELKLRFTGKKKFLKSTEPTETRQNDNVSQSRMEAKSFNPAEIEPPPPPPIQPAQPQQDQSTSEPKTSVTFAVSPETPPPPRFNPPPPPPAFTEVPAPQVPQNTSDGTMTGKQIPEPPPNASNMEQHQGGSAENIFFDNNESRATQVDKIKHDEESAPDTTVTMASKTQPEAPPSQENADLSEEGSLYSTDSEYSSSEPSTPVEDGRPKSILKNRSETPLVNPEQLVIMSDSEYEDDDNLSSQKGAIVDLLTPSNDGYNSNSLDRRGVSFTGDTLDNEGTAKKYEKESINMLKVHKVKPSSDPAVVKPSQVHHQELIKDEPINQTVQSDVKPTDVLVSVESINKEPGKEEVSVNENLSNHVPRKDTPDAQKDTTDGTLSMVKAAEQEIFSPKSNVFTFSDPQNTYNPNPNGVTIVNGTLPSRPSNDIPLVSPSFGNHLKSKNPEMYFTLSRTGDNVSVVNISQDDIALDNTSQRLTMDRYSRDTLRSNFSVGTLRTMISIGGASDLNDTQPSAYPGGDDDTLEHTLPFKIELFEYKKKQTKTGKYQKKAPNGQVRNPKTLKKTTFADQALGYEAQIKNAKKKHKNRKICRIASFVAVIVIILVATVLIVYFLLENDQNTEEAVTATPN